MQNGERLSLEQIQAFLEASGEIEFEAINRKKEARRRIASLPPPGSFFN